MKEYQCSYCRRKTADLTEWLLIQIGEANEQGDNGLPRYQLLCPKCKAMRALSCPKLGG